MLHQLGRALVGDIIQALDQAFRRPHVFSCRSKDTHGFAPASDPAGMGGADDGVACLDGGKNLVDDGRGRVRHRHKGCDHAHRHTDGGNLGHIVAPQNAQRGHVAQVIGHRKGVEQVLHPLVRDIAIAGFLDRHAAQPLCLGFDGAGHGIDHAVDMRRVSAQKLAIGLPSGVGGATGAGDRAKILIHGIPRK